MPRPACSASVPQSSAARRQRGGSYPASCPKTRPTSSRSRCAPAPHPTFERDQPLPHSLLLAPPRQLRARLLRRDASSRSRATGGRRAVQRARLATLVDVVPHFTTLRRGDVGAVDHLHLLLGVARHKIVHRELAAEGTALHVGQRSGV